MIVRFSAKNLGHFKDATINLTPLHAIIGSHDSGKRTILRGIHDVMNHGNYCPGETRLRRISERGTQVIMTTHSLEMVNKELLPGEVTIVSNIEAETSIEE